MRPRPPSTVRSAAIASTWSETARNSASRERAMRGTIRPGGPVLRGEAGRRRIADLAHPRAQRVQLRRVVRVVDEVVRLVGVGLLVVQLFFTGLVLDVEPRERPH